MKTETNHRLDALVDEMSIEEKIGQLTLVMAEQTKNGPRIPAECVAAVRAGRAGTVSHLWGRRQTDEIQRVAIEETRLGIPLLFGADVLHGHRTIFPIPLAEAGAFDPELWERTARAAAEEATADGLSLTYAPMLDVTRDPRWGRMAESPGEDPWLASHFAVAKVRGFQDQDLSAPTSIAATAKHLGAYGAVTAGREYASVDISERTLLETYLPPFKAAVDAGVSSIMPAFTDLAGIPMSANVTVLRDLIRAKWGFEGIYISDYNAITELMSHGVAADVADAAALALRAGIDIDLMGAAYERGLATALERGRVAMGEIDDAVRRVLQLKWSLGLFDDPYRRQVGGNNKEALPLSAERRSLALEAARRSIVLLQNRNSVLPFPETGRIALVGPLADARCEMLGPWASAGNPREVVGILEAVRNAFPAAEIRHARGVDIDSCDVSGIEFAVAVARDADFVVLSLGEAALMSGEAASRGRPDLPGRQRELAEAVFDLRKPTAVLLSSGRPLLVPWLFDRADAVLATWFLGSEAGNAIADVLSGRWNPTGRLAVSWPVDVGQVPVFYSQRRTGRPADPASHDTSKYVDLTVEPLFPFGHGLSYTQFALSDLRAEPAQLLPDETLTVEVKVTNVGAAAGEETVLLFLHDPVASVARPILELKGVEKINLAPGLSGIVRFAVPADAFTFLGTDLSPCIEPGEFEILVGPSSAAASLLSTRVQLAAVPEQR
ncbi:beta-glucosidase [Stappia sp. GBMRC 2046]|uniref:beta-glucosidase n=1 Tax=Stappia sediminis TaxID=2692190 RepID=A0A7X3S615_9HYPH|nr:glycoside hydrolase family 3 N-terminal domain-containing protein [Stappia sediminis]MXN63613.1 beta-glucosidase [Stappia sediminis]